MLNSETVQAKAQQWLDEHRPGAFIYSADEHPWGWAIMYESRRFLETQNIEFLFPDRSPIYITRDGALHPPIAAAEVAPDEQVELFAAKQA